MELERSPPTNVVLVQISELTPYHKILVISPGLIFVQKAVLLGLFSGELIFVKACYRKESCVSKWVWLVNKNSKNTKLTA